MSQKRWDVEVLFFSGPLAMQGPIWYQGPVIRIGRNPGTGGMNLGSYQGVAELHATIEAYEGHTIMISPIEPNVVRVAPHENVNWNQVYPIPGPVKLAEGDIVHIGSLERGSRFKFIQSRSFDWRQGRLDSAVDQSQDEFIENQIEVRKIESGVPKWVIPAFLGTTIVFIAALVIVLIPPPEERPIGLLFDDKDPELTFIMEEELDLEASVLEGFDQPFEDFVMRYNAKESGLDISNDKDMWDDVFYKKTIGAVTHFAKYKSFWKTFEQSLQDYSTVVSMLREDGLPEVFAAIPIQETRYNAKALSPVCAAGIWQFMPEVGNRVGLKIRGCTLSGVGSIKDWKPTRDAAPNVAKTDYVRKEMKASGFKYICKIKSCKKDERIDVEASTTGAIKLLHEAWDDDELKESGSIVQMTIVAHNVGYHDAKFGQKRSTNILPGYRKYSKKSKREHGTHFYGDNIRCGSDKDPHEPQYYASRCGGVIPNQGQHYGYNVVAQHMLAVCYYAQNYGTETVFRPWKTYLNGYCSNIEIPTPEQLEK